MEITRRQCEICGAVLKEGEIRCPICQHDNILLVYKICPNCHSYIPKISKYCPTCGSNVENMITEDIEEQKPKYPDPFLAYNQTPSPEHGNEGYNPSDTSASNTKNQITENQRTYFSEGQAAGEDLRTQLARRQREGTADQSQKEPGVSETTKTPEDTVTSSWWVGPQAPKSPNWTINSDGHLVSAEQKAPEQPDWQNPSSSTTQPNWQDPSPAIAQPDWQDPSPSTTQPDWQNPSASTTQPNWQNPSPSMTPPKWQDSSADQLDMQQQSASLGSDLSTDAEKERWLRYLESNLNMFNEIQKQNNGSGIRTVPHINTKKIDLKGMFNKKNKG